MRSKDVVFDIEALLSGGVAGGVNGNRGEKGDGGIASLEETGGFEVSERSMCIVVFWHMVS